MDISQGKDSGIMSMDEHPKAIDNLLIWNKLFFS